MLMTFKTQKAMPADIDNVWAEITQADFVKQFLPEVSSKKGHTQASYAVPGKVIAWHQNNNLTIKMNNKDLNVDIESIEITLSEQGNQTVASLEVEFHVEINTKALHALRAIRALFHKKLVVLKQDFEHNQIDLAFA